MDHTSTLFIQTFTTLLAIVNPLETLPIFLKLMQGVDAATRIVGFFVSAMGMALVFHGIIEVMQQYGVIPKS